MTIKFNDARDLALAGFDMNVKGAARLELTLEAKPNDLDTRTKLLGYYMHRSIADAKAPRRWAAHCLWVIRNHPDAMIAGLPFCRVERFIDKTAYGKIKALWDRQVIRFRDDIPVISNAARFYAVDEKRKAIALLKRLQRLEHRNPDWRELLVNCND